MKSSVYRKGLVVALGTLCLGFAASPASAVEFPYEFDPALSLTGNCSTTPPDTVGDPGCPGGAHPPSGRFNEPRSIAVDGYGNEYVASFAVNGVEGRIDVFDQEGNFITELLDSHGPKSVAVDSVGNLYVFEQVSGTDSQVVRYSPTVYEPEAGKIEYGNLRVVIATDENTNIGGVAIDASNDRLFAAFASNFIEEYSSAAQGNNLLNTITPAGLSWNTWLAVDAERRRLYASSCKEGISNCGVLVFEADAPYALLEDVDGSNTPEGAFRSQKGWTAIAVDEESGHFFVEDLEQTKKIYEFDENYQYASTLLFNSFQGGNALQIAVSNGEDALGQDAFNRHSLFVPVLSGAGRALAFKPPQELPPVVVTVAATNIAEREAELQATIDPHGGDTHYVFEYVSQDKFEDAEFTNAQIGGEGTISKESQPRQVIGLIDGLSPGTAYRFRVIATNKKGASEKGAAFTTYSDAPSAKTCPNQLLRIGLSSSLPDCRAYELVTPADTNGRPPMGIGFFGDRFATLEASPLGNAVSFATEGGPLPGTEGTGAYAGDLYRSDRGASGWISVGVGPSGAETDTSQPGSTSADQAYAFWSAGGEGSAVVNDRETHYVRYPDGHSELVGRGSLGSDPTAVGKAISEGGAHIIFRTIRVSPTVPQQLEPDAPPDDTEAVYDRTHDEVTHVVSLLPGNVTPQAGEDAQYLAASGDGVGIAFTIANMLYLRVDNAVTYGIGEDLTLAGISEGGRRIFYVKEGDLFAFDTEVEEEIRFTETGDATVVNVAPGGSGAYFVSTAAIPGSGENPNGAIAKAGQQNLYLSEDGQVRFVAAVTLRDVKGEETGANVPVDGLGLWTDALLTGQPGRDPSRVTIDGSVLLFQSRAALDGYDPGGFPQIYRYDSAANRLHCISCIPTRAAGSGGASLESLGVSQSQHPPFSQYGLVPNLSSDGRRAFFESEEALASTDTDDAQDVYEWEEQGIGSCTRPSGCVYLISSGQSARDNYLYGVSRTGDDVFFLTDDVLVAGDDDTLSIYDARVNGGFPQPKPLSCEGEGCRPPLNPPPVLVQPAKAAMGAHDNVSRRCPRGKRKLGRKNKPRCVKKHRKQQHRKTGTKRSAAR
jgi:hypothetical protein